MIPFKILFVDDEEISLLNFRMIFQDRYEIITTLSGEEALEKFQNTENIGLVISDQRMPGISGVELLSTIYESNPETIRVLLTAHSQVEYVLDAINRGQIYQYILKPWNTNELKAIIERAKKLYQLTQENVSLTKELALKNKTLEKANLELKSVNQQLEEDVQRRKKLEASLLESEERFRKFATASQDIIVLFGVDGRGIYANPAVEQLLGYSHAVLFNKPLNFFVHPEYRRVVRKEIEMLLRTNKTPSLREVKIQKKNKEYLDVELNFFCISLESGDRIVGSIIRDITTRKKAREQLRLSEERLGDLSAMLINAQDDERRRIAMELHDEFGQSLAALKMQLRGMENKIDEGIDYEHTAIVDDLRELRQYVNQQISNVRNLSHDLWPMLVDDLGVDAAFDNLIATFLRHADIRLILDMEAIGQFFTTAQQRHLYRLLQESLTNVIKHAKARHITIRTQHRNGIVILSVHDDGVGFDTEAVAHYTGTSRGMGLQAMDERTKILNGKMEIQSTPGEGTTLLFTIRLDDK